MSEVTNNTVNETTAGAATAGAAANETTNAENSKVESLSNALEIIHLLGSPFYQQPLRNKGARYNALVNDLRVAGAAKPKTGTYKCAIPFAVLCVAHQQLEIPRLPVELNTKTGFMPTDVKYITVEAGQEFVMTYLELMLLGMGEQYLFTFRYDGMDNGITIATKLHNFETKQSAFGPRGRRLPTPTLLSHTGVPAKDKMQMICRKDPTSDEPIWGDTDRDKLYKERYYYMYKGHPTREVQNSGKKRISSADKPSVAAQRAMSCRAFLANVSDRRDDT